MRINDSFTSVRVQMPGRRIALACLIVAAIGLAASLAVGPQVQASLFGRFAPAAQWVPFISAGLPLLALLASALCLFGAAAPAPAPEPVLIGNEPSPELLAGLKSIVQELQGVLAAERAQVAALRQSFSAATQDALAASARVARIADAAIDAETRLTAGVAHAEKTLRQPAAVVTWAAEATQRIERAIPELAELIRTGLTEATGTRPDPAFDAAAERLSAAVDGAVETFRTAITDATGRIGALGEVSEALRRDAVALDLAGRQIATAGATVVARASEAVGQVDAALATLPDAVATVTSAAEQVSRGLDEAAAGLRADGNALETASQQAQQAAGALQATSQGIAAERTAMEGVADGIKTAVSQIAAVIASVDAVRADTAGMAELSEKLRDAADVLAEGTNSLDQAGQRVAGRLDFVCEEIYAASEKMTAQVTGALAPLPAAAASLVESAEQASQSLTQAAGEVLTSMPAAAAWVTMAARSLTEASDSANQRMETRINDALTPLPGMIADVARAVTSASASAAQRIAGAVAPLPEAAIKISEAARNMTEASDIMAERIEARIAGVLAPLPDAAAAIAAAGDQAARTLSQAAVTAGERLEARIASALTAIPTAAAAITAAAGQATQTLTEAAAVLCADSAALDTSGQETMQAAAALLREAEALRASGQAISETEREAIAAVRDSVDAAAQRLAALVQEADGSREDIVSLAQVTATLEHVTATLSEGANALDAAGQHIAAAGETVVERLSADASRNEAVMRALPEVAAEIAAAVAGLQIETRSLASAARQIAESGSAGMADAAERAGGITAAMDASVQAIGAAGETIAAHVGRLAGFADQAEHTEAAVSQLQSLAQAMPGTANRLEAFLPRLDHLEALSQRLEAAITQMPAQLAAHLAGAIPATLPDAAARLEAASPNLDRLDTLSQRLEHMLARQPNQDAAAASLAALSGDIGASVRRVEAALSEHDGALIGLMTEIRAAAEARAPQTPPDPANTEEAITATLNHLNGVASQTEALLRQTESLAEAVMAGRAPGLSSLLADRAPALLAGVETTTRRLRSVATALALASDGPPNPARRQV